MKRITLALPAPYVGLRPFTEREAVLFFGREAHVRELLAKLAGRQRFIAVVGASGSGKSSLVRAGLIPALHRGALVAGGTDGASPAVRHGWAVCTFKPGDAPIANLAHALTGDRRWAESDDRDASTSAFAALLATSPLALADRYRQKAELFGDQALLLVVDQFEEIFRYRQQNAEESDAFIKLLLRSALEDAPIYVVITMRADFLGNCTAFSGLPEAINNGLYLAPRLAPDQLTAVITSPLALVGGEIAPELANRLVNTLAGEDELPVLEHALSRMWRRARDTDRRNIDPADFETVCAPPNGNAIGAGAERPSPGAPVLSYAINNHAEEIYGSLPPGAQAVARTVFLALAERREGRDVRRPQTLAQLGAAVGQGESLEAVLAAYRAEGAGFLLPPPGERLTESSMIDISHESLIRQWHRFQQWLTDEHTDVAELREWQHRATRREREGGGWLDQNDCQRAVRWQRDRVAGRGNPAFWTARYVDGDAYSRVDAYIRGSLDRLDDERCRREELERRAEEEEQRRLEAEAQLQREALERAEGERAQAVAEKERAEAFARATRRRSVIAAICAAGAVVFAVTAMFLWLQANTQRKTALAGELAATAENLAREEPDVSLLLALEALRLSPAAKAQAAVRAARGLYSYERVLRGHEGAVTAAQFSPDGSKVVTASADNTARLWDAASGRELAVLRGHANRVLAAQFSPDGSKVVTASDDKTARLWDAASGRELAVLRGHESFVRAAQFSPDGSKVVTASADKTARLWDAASGRELAVLRGHENSVWAAQFSPDGSKVVTASDDKTARLWDAASGRELAVLRGHESFVWAAQFSPDGSKVVTASEDDTARLWPCGVCRPVRELVNELTVMVGRTLTDDERRRFGLNAK